MEASSRGCPALSANLLASGCASQQTLRTIRYATAPSARQHSALHKRQCDGSQKYQTPSAAQLLAVLLRTPEQASESSAMAEFPAGSHPGLEIRFCPGIDAWGVAAPQQKNRTAPQSLALRHPVMWTLPLPIQVPERRMCAPVREQLKINAALPGGLACIEY